MRPRPRRGQGWRKGGFKFLKKDFYRAEKIVLFFKVRLKLENSDPWIKGSEHVKGTLRPALSSSKKTHRQPFPSMAFEEIMTGRNLSGLFLEKITFTLNREGKKPRPLS